MCAMNYYVSPSEQLFRDSGTIYHLYTKALESDIYFSEAKEKNLALNYMAMSVKKSGARLLAYSVMSNHFHFILMGSEAVVKAFFTLFRDLMASYFRFHGRPGLMDSAELGLTSINTLVQLRNEIAYVIRNNFVVRKDVNVFADPWSSGFLYFNPLLNKDGVPASLLKSRDIREFTRSRVVKEIDPEIFVKDGVACPWSFVDYNLTMQFYDSARQYVDSVIKNVEAQIETAMRYGESLSVSDDEMISVVYRISRQKFGNAKPRELNDQDKKQLAIILKREYNSSNGQIARLTSLPQRDVDALFPLATKA